MSRHRLSGETQSPEEKKWGEPPSLKEQPINEPLTAEETRGLKQHVRESIIRYNNITIGMIRMAEAIQNLLKKQSRVYIASKIAVNSF